MSGAGLLKLGRLGDIELMYWDGHMCTISKTKSSSDWTLVTHRVLRLQIEWRGSSSYQTLSSQAAVEGVSTAQASNALSEVWMMSDSDILV